MSDKKIISFKDDKTFNFYANSSILFFGLIIVLYIFKRNKRNLRDEESYNWNKYKITSETKSKSEGKDKNKARVKEYSKGTGFIKDENKFTTGVVEEKKKDLNFLNIEEVDNLQDMINFAAEINQNEKNVNIYPIESLYSQVLRGDQDIPSQILTNEKIDGSIAEILKNTEMDDTSKIKKILDLYTKLLGMKNKNLSETTYIGLVELFMKNGYLSHASYFLCQMDRLKIKIPRSLLDLFLDYSINNKIFERKEEITFKNNNYDLDKTNNKTANDPNFNKFDQYAFQEDPSFAHYFKRRTQQRSKKDIQEIFTKLKVDAKPFFPKSVEDEQFDKLKTKLSEIDPSKVKEFVPKSYRVVKKEEN